MAVVATRRIKTGGQHYLPGADLSHLTKKELKHLVERGWAAEQVTAAEIARAEEAQRRLEAQTATLRERIVSAEERIASLTGERDAIDIKALTKAVDKAKPDDAEAAAAALADAQAQVAALDEQIAQATASRDETAELLRALEA